MFAESEQGNEVKVILLGDSGVGKTSIAQRFVYDFYMEQNPTSLGASFRQKTIVIPNKNKMVNFQIWDTAGQEIYRSMAKMYYKDAAAAILVYDCTQKKTFEGVKEWIKELQENASKDIIMAIAGNKSDLINDEMIKPQVGMKLAKSVNGIFKQTSAKQNFGIQELFVDIASYLEEFDRQSTTIVDQKSLKLQKRSKHKKGRKCC